jgi:hypothetical protein
MNPKLSFYFNTLRFALAVACTFAALTIAFYYLCLVSFWAPLLVMLGLFVAGVGVTVSLYKRCWRAR